MAEVFMLDAYIIDRIRRERERAEREREEERRLPLPIDQRVPDSPRSNDERPTDERGVAIIDFRL